MQAQIADASAGYQQATSAIADQQRAADDLYASQMARYQEELAAVEQIRAYVDSLSLSALSPLSPAEMLAEARRQYETALASGDKAALPGAADAYLQQAQGYYDNTDAYREIFGQVKGQLEGAGAATPVEPMRALADTLPVLAEADLELQTRISEIQTGALAELEALDALLAQTAEDERAQFDQGMATLEAAYLDGSSRIVAATHQGAERMATVVQAALDRMQGEINAANARAEAAQAALAASQAALAESLSQMASAQSEAVAVSAQAAA
jgi:hypothetical protein